MEARKGRTMFVLGLVLLLIGLAGILTAVGLVSRKRPVPPAPTATPAPGAVNGLVEQVAAEYAARLAAIEQKLAASEARLEIERKAQDPLRAQLTEWRVAKESAETEARRLAPLPAELAAAREQIAALTKQVNVLKAEAEKGGKDLKTARERNATLQKQVSQMAAAKAVGDRALTEAQLQAKTAAERAKLLETEVAAMKDSLAKLTSAHEELKKKQAATPPSPE